jgi:hypothetical protein
MAASTAAQASQKFVPVKEVRSGIIVLKDGGYRGVLMCSSVNFGLKSADEQRAIISGFQTFLNTLDFSIQILVNSRRMDMRPYLALLEGKMNDQKTELLRIQLREYLNFIHSFADQTNIMSKTFYIVVPYAGSASEKVAGALSLIERISPVSLGRSSKTSEQDRAVTFEEARTQLEQRLALVSGGLSGTGIRAVPLGTEEVIELLYRSFNPGELENPIRLDT